jgi:hypothetical protein
MAPPIGTLVQLEADGFQQVWKLTAVESVTDSQGSSKMMKLFKVDETPVDAAWGNPPYKAGAWRCAKDAPPPSPPMYPVTVHGDPMFKVDGKGTHFWLEEGKLTPLMSWRSMNGHSMTLSGRTFSRNSTANQWFKELVVDRDGVVVFNATARATFHHAAPMDVELDGELIQPAPPSGDVTVLSSKTSGLKMWVSKQGAEQKVNVRAGGTLIEVVSARAAKFAHEKMQTRYKHLNIRFPHGFPGDASGLFAELAGLQPMSDATQALLVQAEAPGAPAPNATSSRWCDPPEACAGKGKASTDVAPWLFPLASLAEK